MDDNSDNKKNPSRRRVLRILGLGGIVVATVALPGKWRQPIIESIIVPAHAQSSPKSTSTTIPTDNAPTNP